MNSWKETRMATARFGVALLLAAIIACNATPSRLALATAAGASLPSMALTASGVFAV